MTKDRKEPDSGVAVTTKENVTPVVSTVSYTTSSATTVECLLGATGFKAILTSAVSMEDRTPITEPKVGWIYDMNKELLISEMSRYGLSTSGNVETLRRRFCDFWQNATSQTPLSEHTIQPVTLSKDEASGWSTANERHGTVLQDLTNESANVREILGLSPNTDTATVRRLLTSLVTSSSTASYGEWSTSHSRLPVPSRGQSTKVTYCGNVPRVSPEISPNLRSVNAPFSTATSNFTPARMCSQVQYPPATPHGTRSGRDCASICQSVRKWNLKFDGKRDPVSFIKRLEELIDAYAVPEDEIVHALPELLTGLALLWYRNTKDLLIDYRAIREYFELQFLPAGYVRNLDEEVRARTQGEHESFREFVITISTLIRRCGSFSVQAKLDIVYKNMKPEYKIMVRHQECVTLADLISRTEVYESYVRDKESFRPPPSPALALVAETAYVGRRRSSPVHDQASVDKKSTQRGARIGDTPDGRGKAAAVVSRVSPAVSPRPSGQRSDRDSSVREGRSLTCWNCGKAGHMSRECKQLRHPRDSRNRDTRQTWHRNREAGNERPAQDRRGLLGPVTTDPERAPANGESG